MHPHLKLELTRRRMTALNFKESLRRKSEGSESGTAAHGHSPAKVKSHFFLTVQAKVNSHFFLTIQAKVNSHCFLTIQAKVNSHFFILQTSANSPLFAILQPPETLKLDGFCTQITPLTSFSAVCEQDYLKPWPRLKVLGVIRNPFPTIGEVVLSTQMKHSIHAPTPDQPSHRLSVMDLVTFLNPSLEDS